MLHSNIKDAFWKGTDSDRQNHFTGRGRKPVGKWFFFYTILLDKS